MKPRDLLRRLDRWHRLACRLFDNRPQMDNHKRQHLLREFQALTETVVQGLGLEVDSAPFAHLERLLQRYASLPLFCQTEQSRRAARADIIGAMREALDARDRVVQMAGKDSPRRKELDARDRLALAVREEVDARATFGPSADFSSFHWRNEVFTFTAPQAACIQILWTAFKAEKPVLSQDYVLTEAGLNNPRLRDVFKGNPAWGALIVQAETAAGKGKYYIRR